LEAGPSCIAVALTQDIYNFLTTQPEGQNYSPGQAPPKFSSAMVHTMQGIVEQGAQCSSQLRALRQAIVANNREGVFEKTLGAMSVLQQALADDVDALRVRGRRRQDDSSLHLRIKMQRVALKRTRREIAQLKEKLERLQNSKVSGRIQSLWFIRVGLATPTIAATTLSQWCRDWPEEETKNIAPSYIGRVRDAMAEEVK
jgi:hypothetical protein